MVVRPRVSMAAGPFPAEPHGPQHLVMHLAPGNHGPLRVVVVDADDRVRESLAGLLCIGGHLTVVGSAGQSATAIDLVLETKPDIVILDPRLPEIEAGLTLIRKLRQAAPEVRILVASGVDAFEGVDLVRCGDGFVRKTYRPNDLVAAVIAAAVPLVG